MKNSIIFFLTLLMYICTNAQNRTPLPIPENFDPSVNMLSTMVNGEKIHWAYANAQFVEKLLDNGTPRDIELAKKIIPSLLSTQELRKKSPHYGGFRWELESSMVNDLNAVEFVLDALIPAMIRNENKLDKQTADTIKQAIRLGLKNIANIDVGLKYTNIVLKDISNTSLGGELLGDTAIANRGYRKMKQWMEFTDHSGSAYEYNSLPYTAVALDVLSKLEKQITHEPTRIRAKLMLARLSLTTGLHMHAPTKRWAGPHGRAYHNSYTSDGGWYKLAAEELTTIEEWIEDETIPEWIEELLTEKALPNEVIETVGRNDEIFISTQLTEDYTFGVASRNMANQANRFIAWQSNVFSSNYVRTKREVPGTIYTRYILNNEWLGDFAAGPGRPKDMLIPDRGHFQGIMENNRAIGLYAPRGLNAMDHYSSAKSVIAFPRWNDAYDEIWIEDQKVTTFPAEFKPGQTVIISSGEMMLGLRPFTISNLATGPQLFIKLLDDPDHTLVVELYNYDGPEKTFWELAWPGTFYQGQPQNGFYAEIVSKKDVQTPSQLSRLINRGEFIDEVDPKLTYTGVENRSWKVGYQRDGKKLGMTVDLFDWFKSPKRWNSKGEISMPMLQSKWAIENRTGKIDLNGCSLATLSENAAWLYTSPSGNTVVAGYHGTAPSPLYLKLADGSSIEIPQMEQGIIIWEKGKVSIDALGIHKKPILKKCSLK
ncbi:hypothetical protein HX109_13065 [Galbibacter sp. BG1]|uniref:hypothetical protein n=1 Tax=Galbibacter sp. BG1 TaxID=1170699 RepID=UPI0015BE2E42|nr:hypothetical protein [Galbibacter sp. BG1]QLE02441.1 hypothetical protein HX109_13065 [Galbibacter sp. BG1]